MTSGPAYGLITWAMALIYGLGGVWGLPPGTRDAKLVRSAPADAVFYAEWSERVPGKSGGKEFEGLVADPEFVEFLQKVDSGLSRTLLDNMESSGNGLFKPEMIPEFAKGLGTKPGCFFLGFDVNRINQARKQATEAGKTLTQAQGVLAGLESAVLINFGARTEAFEKGILELLRMLRGRRFTKPERLAALALPELRLPFPVVLHRHEEYLILASSESVIAPLVERLQGKESQLEKNTRFQKSFKNVRQERMGAYCWCDVKRGLDVAGSQFGLQGAVVKTMAAMTGLDQMEAFACSAGLKDGQIVNRTFLDQGGQKDRVWSLFGGAGLKGKDFETVPLNATMVLGLSIDSAQVLHELRNLMKNLQALNVTGGKGGDPLTEIEAKLGFSLEKDLFPALGQSWTVYDAPETGGLLGTGLVAQVEIRDPQRARRMLNQVVQIIRRQLPPFDERSNGANLAEGEFLGERIYFLNLMLVKAQPWAPAFCLTETHLIVAVHPQALKGHLRFLKDPKSEKFASRLGGEKGKIEVPSGELICLNYLNLERVGQVLLPLVPYLGELGMAQFQRSNIDIDVLAIPSPAGILPYLKSHVSVSVRTEEGIVGEARGSLPPGLVGWSYWVVPLGLWSAMQQ